MNLKDLLASFSALWARHSPTVIVHLALLVILVSYVLSGGNGLFVADLWRLAKQAIDDSLKEVGIQIERGYVIVALVYLYLTACQWVAGMVGSIPGLRVRIQSQLTPELASRLARFVPTDNDMFDVDRKLWRQWDDIRQAQQEHDQSSTLGWYDRNISLWSRYLGLSVIAFVGVLAWRLEGASGAVSAARVTDIALALFAFALLSRWRLGRWVKRREESSVWSAIEAYERKRPPVEEHEPIVSLRARLISETRRFRLALDRHPTSVLRNLIFRLHLPFRQRLLQAVPHSYPRWNNDDWLLFDSALRLHSEERTQPPIALRVDAFRSRFASLLECRGAGLCILVADDTGLAPAVRDFGASYCFAERSHEGRRFPLRYSASSSGAGLGTFEFARYGGEGWGVLADMGPQRIELIAQHRYGSPSDGNLAEDWFALFRADLDTAGWSRGSFRAEGETVHGVHLCSSVPAVLGHSYFLRARIQAEGPEAVIAFQCFGAGDAQRLLIAWKIIAIYGQPSRPPLVRPWWSLPFSSPGSRSP